MKRWWADHSLSATLTVLGLLLVGGAVPYREGMAFDLLSGFGMTFLTGAIINLLSGPLREKNRPDK